MKTLKVSDRFSAIGNDVFMHSKAHHISMIVLICKFSMASINDACSAPLDFIGYPKDDFCGWKKATCRRMKGIIFLRTKFPFMK